MNTAADLVRFPLRAVDALFAQKIAAAGSTNALLAEWGEKEHLVRTLGLEDEERFAQIPCLNDVDLSDSLLPFSLVRYRGLVQDIFEPEIYAATLHERVVGAHAEAPARLVTTKYRECVEAAPGCCLDDIGREGLGQRGACYCVPLPGESAWARAHSAAAAQRATPMTPPPLAAAKRARPDDDVEMTPEEPLEPREPRRVRPVVAPANGRGASIAAPGSLRSANEFGLNFPLPSEERHGQGAWKPCIVKLYDGDVEGLRLCETVEIVGVLCINPELATFEATPLEEGLGRDARQPSSALVPRIHAILIRRLPFYHPLLPFSPDWLSEARLVAAFQNRLASPGAVAAARSAAVEQLRQHLGGDALAAEYVLMLLVSRSFGKHGDQSLGCWTLNITNWPENAPARGFSNAAGELVPRSVCLEVTSDTLGSQRWRPRKDFEANRLVAAQLQLAPGTLLVLDETKMAEGQVSVDGVKALAAISALVTQQELTCDYMSFDVKVPLELSCILISRNRSIIKDLDVALPLRPCGANAAALPVQNGSIDAARFLLGLVTRRPRPIQIPDEVAQRFGEDFAAVRQEFQVHPGLCNAWMGMARAHCLCFAEEGLTVPRWHSVLQLERERLGRCRESGHIAS